MITKIKGFFDRSKNALKNPVQIKWYHILMGFMIILAFMGDSSCSSQTTQSNVNADTASSKWGNSPNITNYYEYKQLKDIYEARDNPKLVLNAYLYSPMTGQLTCFGKVIGYGVPYGTSWSQPIGSGNQGSIPEPNALYPSSSTNADWVQTLTKDGKTHITFVEPDLIITDMDYACTPLKGDTTGSQYNP